ncbi:hypothetical protein [Chryseobacterium aquaeductus]|uniref:hypothetical protein n=1 Tax=Chryseobacterium aquaeductus TaxID=2675056 RepID=UPI00138A45DC|nr:hypothetical protein [Chryseobacterium aquaeductus]
MKIEGLIKQPTNEIRRSSIVINDTLNKIPESDRSRRDEILRNQNLVTVNDDKGYFTITAKPSDSIFFRFGRFYHPEKYLISDLMKLDKIIIDPKSIPCIPQKKCDQEIPSHLYIFVGKKINVSYVDTSMYCGGRRMDTKYNAVYQIEQEFGEHHLKPTINFTAYDHDSKYEYDFTNYDNVLIFVGEFCGDLIQLKYQFFPVYKTKDGRWATPIDTYMESSYKSDQFIPTNIIFDKPVAFDLLRSNKNPSEEQIAQLKKIKFSEKYYKIENGKVIPIMGRYAEDLVKLWNELYWEKLK